MIEQPDAPLNQPVEILHQEVLFPGHLHKYYDLNSAIVLGEGSIGTTFRVKRKDSASFDVLKKIQFERYFSCAWDVWEDGSQMRTQHGNMIETFSGPSGKESHFLVMKWMKKGNLKTLVGFGERTDFACLLDVCCVLSGVVDGLSFLENTNRAFGVLHLSNVLVGDDNTGILGDMLFSKPNIRDAFDVRSGRALHLAPELLDEPDLYRATPQSDVWAFGILLLESVLGLNPFSLMEGDRLRDGVRGLNLDVFFESLSPKHSKRASPNFRFLVTECLKQNPSERITFQSMKERQLIRSLLSLPEDIASFDATIARQNEHKRNSGEEWRPFGRLEVDMVGVGMCEIGFHPFLSRKGIIESVRIPPDFDKDSLLVVVDNPPLMNEWTMAEEPITPESHVVIYKNQHEYAMEHRKDQSYRLKQSLSKDKAEFYVMIQTGDIFKFPMEHTNDTVQSLFEEITKKFLYLPDERCLLTFRGKPLIRSYLLKEYGIAPGDRLNFTWRMLG